MAALALKQTNLYERLCWLGDDVWPTCMQLTVVIPSWHKACPVLRVSMLLQWESTFAQSSVHYSLL